MRKLAWILIALALFVLQGTVIPFLFGGVSQPNLILVFTALVALHIGLRAGIGTALLGGLIQDMVIGNFFGLYLFPYIIIAFVYGFWGNELYRGDQWSISVIAAGFASAVCSLLTLAILWMDGDWQMVLPWTYLWQLAVPQLCYSMVIALPVYSVLWQMHKNETYMW